MLVSQRTCEKDFRNTIIKRSSQQKHMPLSSLFTTKRIGNMKDAKRRETYFKTTKGRAVLKNMLKEYFFEQNSKQCLFCGG